MPPEKLAIRKKCCDDSSESSLKTCSNLNLSEQDELEVSPRKVEKKAEPQVVDSLNKNDIFGSLMREDQRFVNVSANEMGYEEQQPRE